MAKNYQLGPEIERYTQLLARDPDSLAFVPLADAYRKNGLFEEAFAVLKRGMGWRPDYIPAKIVLGKCYLDLGNLTKAEELFREILKTDADNLVALSCQANIRLHQRRYGEAATIYRRILKLDPSSGAAAHQLAKLEGKSHGQGRDEAAEIDLESATGTPTEQLSGATGEVPVPDTMEFENVLKSGVVPPAPQKETRPGAAGGVPKGDEAEAPPTEIDLDDISPAAPRQESDVTPPKPAPAPEKDVAPLEDLKGDGGLPPVKRAGDEPEIEVPVPPPPDTEELDLVEPEAVEVMPEDEVPPEIPPVKDTSPLVHADETEKPAFKTFSSWLSEMAGRKEEEGKDEEPTGE